MTREDEINPYQAPGNREETLEAEVIHYTHRVVVSQQEKEDFHVGYPGGVGKPVTVPLANIRLDQSLPKGSSIAFGDVVILDSNEGSPEWGHVKEVSGDMVTIVPPYTHTR